MRLFITTLSMFSVIAFGYALAGYGGGVIGGSFRADYITIGLSAGFAFAAAAMLLWYKHRDEFFTDEPYDAGTKAEAPDMTLGLPEDTEAE